MFIPFYYWGLFTLPIIVSGLIGDWKSVTYQPLNSYYKGSLPLSIARSPSPSLRPLRGSAIPFLRCFACPILRRLFIPSILDVREILSIMFQILIGYVSYIDYGLVFQLHLSEHLCIPPSILTLRSFASLFRNASPVHSYGGNARSSFYHFIRRRLLALPIIVSGFNRRLEIGDITTVDSHYKGSGTSER